MIWKTIERDVTYVESSQKVLLVAKKTINLDSF